MQQKSFSADSLEADTTPSDATNDLAPRGHLGRLRQWTQGLAPDVRATHVLCLVGGVALEQLAPGSSKTLNPVVLRQAVQHSLLGAKAVWQRGMAAPIPSLPDLVRRLAARHADVDTPSSPKVTAPSPSCRQP